MTFRVLDQVPGYCFANGIVASEFPKLTLLQIETPNFLRRMYLMHQWLYLRFLPLNGSYRDKIRFINCENDLF